jgi:dTMP kinase
MNPVSPSFVVFEGLDGVGKSMSARATAEALQAVYMTTPSESVRQYRDSLIKSMGDCQEAHQLFYLATVFSASREADALLRTGRSVVLDRYFLSTQAYADFRGSVLRIDDVQQHLRPADVTVLLEAPLEVRRLRIRARGGSAADGETLRPDADARLHATHAARTHLPVIGRLLRIDTSLSTPADVAAQVLAALAASRAAGAEASSRVSPAV